MKDKMEWSIGCCWEEGAGHENAGSLSIQQMNRAGKELVLILLCKGHSDACGEEEGGYAAERLTEWFYREFAPCCSGRGRVRLSGIRKQWLRKSLVHCFSSLHEDIAALERKTAAEKRGGVSIELLAIQDKRLCHAHVGEGRCYRIRGRRARLMQRPHIAGRNILLRSVGHGIFMPPDLQFIRLGRQEGLVIGEDWIFQGWKDTELKRIFDPSIIMTDHMAGLRVRELCHKMCRLQGKRAVTAAVGIMHRH